MRINFESFSALQYRNRALARQVEEFKSGEKYVKMAADYKKLLDFHNKEMKRMERELARAHSEAVTVRKYWGEVMDDLDKEHQEETAHLLAKIGRLEKENLELARQRDKAKDKLKERTRQYYEAASELEEERGKNKKLTAQVNKYFENSHDKRVPANNSLCERLARVYKRKQKQAVTLRSQENLCYICDGLSIVYLLRSNEENVYQKIAEIYDRERPPKQKNKTDATA